MSGDSYLWAASSADSWDVAGNWDDTTTGASPAAAAPDGGDAVTIDAAVGGAVQEITGTGASASLTILGATDLVGQFTTGALNFQVSDPINQPLVLGGGDSLAVSGDVTSDGTIEVNGGSFAASGAVTTFNLEVSDGGSAQINGSLSGAIQVDSTSTAEIGYAQTATAGQLVIDAGMTPFISASATDIINNGTAGPNLSASDSIVNNGLLFGFATAATIVNNGTINADLVSSVDGAGTLTNSGTISGFSELSFANIVNSGTIAATNASTADLIGSVTGTGQITIGGGASLQVSGQVGSGNTITFAGGNGSLLISGSLSAPIAGFDASDVIDFSDYNYVTSASYADGTLTLYEGATSVATLQLAGNYTGATFLATPTTSQNGYPDATQIDVVMGGDTGTPPAGTSTSDSYLWAGPVAGSWDVKGNWDDATNPAAVAPGANDAVTIDATPAGAAQVITGTGASASLTILGATDLMGQFTTGALNFLAPYEPLYVGGGDSLSVSGAVASAGTIAVDGGSFTANGPVSADTLDVSNGGSVQIGESFTGQIQVDSSSAAEIGSSDIATAGQIVVDAGASVSGSLASSVAGSGALINNGTIADFSELSFGAIVNSGTIAATSPYAAELVGSVTGTGEITIANGAALQVSGQVGAGNTITFAGGDGSLLISGSLNAPIAGFDATDAIDFSDYNYVTSASYANGTLTLYEGATSVATLQLAGAYTGAAFTVTQVASQTALPDTTQISLVNVPPVLTAPTSVSAPDGVSTAVTGISITDADAASADETLTVVLTDQAGLLSANTDATGGGGAITGSGSNYLTISGDLAQVNADLSTVTLLSNTAGSDSIAISADDGRGGESDVQITVSITGPSGDTPPSAQFPAIFNNVATSNVLWHNTDGDTAIWYMNSTTFSPVDLGVVDPGWVPLATADFNADGNADILWRNTNGEVGEWLSSAGGFTKLDLGNVDPSWNIQAIGDFNGDGASDLLWRNTNGEVGEWLSNGGAGGFNELDLGNVDPSWSIAGVGDFNGDGKTDIWWSNANGEVGLWLSNGGTGPSGFTELDLGNPGASWVTQDLGDFNGDGKTDILWRNTNGEVGLWLSNGGTGPSAFTKLDLGNVSTSWVIQGIGDFTGDGKTDILWRNTNGEVGLWLSNGAAGGFTELDLGNVSTSWVIQGIGDFTGSGRADILWRNTDGDVGEWLSNGGSGFNGFDEIVLANAPTSWSVVGDNSSSATPPAAPTANVVRMAHAMAAMDAPAASAATASIAQAAAGAPPMIAVAGHQPSGLTA